MEKPKCPNCGATEFDVIESTTWKTWYDDEGDKDENGLPIVHCKNRGCEIELLCSECGTDVTEFEENLHLNFL